MTVPMRVWMVALWFAVAAGATAAELRVIVPGAVKNVLPGIAGEFERATGHRVTMMFGTGGAVLKRALDGEAGDIVIAAAEGLDRLVRENRVVAGTRTDLGVVEVGMAVRRGAPVPDISTPEKFREVLLNAPSITYSDPAAGGLSTLHLVKVLEALGIAEALRPKTVLGKGGADGGVDNIRRVASGEVAVGFTQISEIIQVEGATLVGPLPKPHRSGQMFSAGLMTASTAPEAARAFLARLADADARKRFAAAGLTPP